MKEETVPKFLSEEWVEKLHEMAAGQPTRPGASARLQYVVTGGPEGDVHYYWVVEDGKLLEAARGDLTDAEITLTETWDDAVKIQKGELDANVAFMQGRLKVTGNMGKLMALLPITMSAEYRQLMADLTSLTV